MILSTEIANMSHAEKILEDLKRKVPILEQHLIDNNLPIDELEEEVQRQIREVNIFILGDDKTITKEAIFNFLASTQIGWDYIDGKINFNEYQMELKETIE